MKVQIMEWLVYIDTIGTARCGYCCSPLYCDKNGYRPIRCPRCGAELNYRHLPTLYKMDKNDTGMYQVY